jgi:hypothetical protein
MSIREEIREIETFIMIPSSRSECRHIFVCSDGLEFTKKSDAELHERYLKIPKKSWDCNTLDLGDFSESWYKITNQDDAEFLNKEHKIKINYDGEDVWYLLVTHDSSNGYWCEVYTEQTIKNMLLNMLQTLPSEGEHDKK